MFFDTESFIQEVQPRECLWNSSLDSYTDRAAKRSAWEEIAPNIYKNWDQLSSKEQDEKINDLAKKWRNLRDNYKREKRKDHYISGEGVVNKKKKYAYTDMLSFLDSVVQNRPYRTSLDFQNDSKDCSSTPDFDTNKLLQIDLEEIDVMEEERALSSEISARDMMQLPNHSMPLPNISRFTEDLKVTASRDFLLSLLPDVLSMNERQNMRFRLGVLNLISDIRFSESGGDNPTADKQAVHS